MAKLIVTHFSPDLDAIASIWLLSKFHPDFSDYKLVFVPAGEKYSEDHADSKLDIVHVDTGLGKYDHHQTSDFTCAAKLVYESLKTQGYIKKDDEVLDRMIEIITQMDHGQDCYKWCEADNDRYEFSLHNILTGWKILFGRQEEDVVKWGMHALDAVYKLLQVKAEAEKELQDGTKFKTRWGKGVGVYTSNDGILDLAVKKGYAVVFRKDPVRGFLRVTGSNSFNVNLTDAYEMFQKKDPDATWFLHVSKVLLRNGSSKNLTMKPTKLGMEEIIEVLEKA